MSRYDDQTRQPESDQQIRIDDRTDIGWHHAFHTWTVNRGYYGVSYDTDRNTTRWAIEYVQPNTEAGARAIARRAADLDALVVAHAKPDAGGNRRCRLAMRWLDDGRLEIREYDWSKWTATI